MFIKQVILKLIRIYQKTLSLDHGFFSGIYSERLCRFHPTCSEYTYQAIEHDGLCKGSLKGLWRVLHCHPWNQGGYDPIVKK